MKWNEMKWNEMAARLSLGPWHCRQTTFAIVIHVFTVCKSFRRTPVLSGSNWWHILMTRTDDSVLKHLTSGKNHLIRQWTGSPETHVCQWCARDGSTEPMNHIVEKRRGQPLSLASIFFMKRQLFVTRLYLPPFGLTLIPLRLIFLVWLPTDLRFRIYCRP